jgi:trehalose utilization protein
MTARNLPQNLDSGSPRVIRVTFWGENIAEQCDLNVREIYPEGLHAEIAAALREYCGESVNVRTATLEQPEHGLSSDSLAATDVLVWWGHLAHHLVSDEVAAKVQARVLEGMGLVVLHSGHLSKPFTRLMGTTCMLRWRKDDDREVVWTVNPTHPIVYDVPSVFLIPRQEMYGEFFDIPAPDELVFISSFPGGEVFRSGCCFYRGKGRIFYFSPGHETYPVYHQAEVRRVIANSVIWAYVACSSPVDIVSTEASRRGWFEYLDAP